MRLENGALKGEQAKQFSFQAGDTVSMTFMPDDRILVWSSRDLLIEPAIDMGDKFQLQVRDNKDYLVSSTLLQAVPLVKVKQEFEGKVEICFSHNSGHNIYKTCTFNAGDFQQTIDSVWEDIYLQWIAYHHPEKLHHYNQCIGNIGYLTEWSNLIPEHDIELLLPFGYSESPGLAFPLCLLDKKDKVYHSLKPRGKGVTSILRMRKMDDQGNWTDVKEGKALYLEDGDTEMPKPMILNEYATLNEEDKKKLSECATESHLREKDPVANDKIVYAANYRDVYIPDPKELATEKSPGSTAISKSQSTSPTLAFFWCFVDLEYQATCNFSNYTTACKVEDGSNPAGNFSLVYKDKDKLEDLPSVPISKAEASKGIFPSAPYEEGYNAFSHSFDLTTEYSEVGVVHSALSAEFSCSLKQNIPDSDKRKFALLVRHLRLRRFLITDKGKIRPVM